jgi:predicted GNAT family acetyltransferase
MNLFGNRKRDPQIVTSGNFELESDGRVATLEYTLDGQVLTLIHTEIPAELRGKGVASSLAQTALDWARENNLKVDVVCPFVADYLHTHPEYSDLILH